MDNSAKGHWHVRCYLACESDLTPPRLSMQLIPVGAVQALVNVQLLNKIPPFKQLLKIQFTNALIVSILPGARAGSAAIAALTSSARVHAARQADTARGHEPQSGLHRA